MSRSVLSRKGSLGFSMRMPGDQMNIRGWENGAEMRTVGVVLRKKDHDGVKGKTGKAC